MQNYERKIRENRYYYRKKQGRKFLSSALCFPLKVLEIQCFQGIFLCKSKKRT